MKIFTRIARSIRNNIVVGLFLVTPVGVTILVINLVFNWTTSFLPRALRDSNQALMYRGIALAAIIVALFFIGLLARNFLGRRLYQLGDAILTRIPIISKVYLSIRQVSETLIAQRETLFSEVVLVEYPRKGLFSMGFVTAHLPPHLSQLLEPTGQQGPFVALFIPTTPNPTSGLFIMVSHADCIHVPINIADAMKLVVSGGAVMPGETGNLKQPNLLDRLDRYVEQS